MSTVQQSWHDGPATDGPTVTEHQEQTHVRATLRCPSGHMVVSANSESRIGRSILAGDFSDEFCGYGSCSWDGSEVNA